MSHVYLGQHTVERGSQLQAWIMSNGVDPQLVVHESVAQVHGPWLTFVVFKYDRRTKSKVLVNGRFEKEFLTVPLNEQPETFGL